MNWFVCFLKRWIGLGFIQCLRTHRLLFDYVEDKLAPETRRKLDAHLKDCPHCLEYTQSYRETISMCQKHYPLVRRMPPELKRKLEEFVESGQA